MEIYMAKKFTSKAESTLGSAKLQAEKLGHTYIGSEHILLALSMENESVGGRILAARGVDSDELRELICHRIGVGEETKIGGGNMTPKTKRIIEGSGALAERTGQKLIGTEHILLSLTEESDCMAVRLLTTMGISSKDIASDITDFLGNISAERRVKAPVASLKSTPTIAQYGRNLTASAAEGRLDPIIGREEETERLISILSRRTKNNPCLIGEPGVGKTAVVEGLAERIVSGNVPDSLSGKVVVALDLSAMIAGAKYRGEFEERMKAVMNEARANPSIILFIDEIHTVIGAGAAEGAVDAANIIKPALARGELKLIGATTTAEYRRHIEKDSALERRFGTIYLSEPTKEETMAILRGLRGKYESHHGVKITDDALEAAINLSVRYVGDKYLPDKAIDLIDEAASKCRITAHTSPPSIKKLESDLNDVRIKKEAAIKSQDFELAASLRDRERELNGECHRMNESWKKRREHEILSIDSEDIADILEAKTGIPVKKLAGEESEKLSRLPEILKSRIIGQDKAVDALSRALLRGRMGLKDPRRPIGSFIFLGPTGVGKTALSKALAEILFGDENAVIRFDMSEFLERHSVSKLIGSPPGYVGYSEGGILTERIRRKPYSVVLFDELEKAHPDVLNILLQILDDGTLTDSDGTRADFKNAVIIMTSNVGASEIGGGRKSLGFTGTPDGEESLIKKRLTESFKPEFLNRVDETIVFNRLSKEAVERITALMLDEVRGRLKKLSINAVFPDETVKFIAEAGYDSEYGAREIRRTIARKVEDYLASKLASGEISAGDEISVVKDGSGVRVEKLK